MKPTAGFWDQDLYDRFRRARPRSAVRRILASQLVVLNEPLIKTLCAQLLGRDDLGRRAGGFAHKAGRVYDADRLEWEDAMQLARIGFARAIETFDAKKGGIAGYARWWIKDQFQRVTCISAPITTPQRKDDQRPGCELVSPMPVDRDEGARGVQWLGDVLGHDEGGVLAVEGLTPAMLAEWERTGEWPATLDEAIDLAKPKAPVVYSIPRPAFEVFAATRCRFVYTGRVTQRDVWEAFRTFCRVHGHPDPSRVAFARQLSERGISEKCVRLDGEGPTRGYAGLRLQTAA